MSQYQPPRPYQPPQPYRPQQPHQTPPPQAYQPPPQSYAYYPPQPPVQHVVHHYQAPPKSAGTAVLLELLPGFFFQTFGIGHIYAGRVGAGLLFMFGYWLVLFVNLLLCLLLIGFFTLPLCWLLTMIVSSLVASNAASRSGGGAYR